MKKQATITSSIIVVLIILGGLVYWSLNKNHTFYNNENINENVNNDNVNVDNINTEIDTSNWVTFEDKELGISYKHPVDCWQNGAGPGTEATNIVNCYEDVFMAYQPINYSYNKGLFDNFDNLSTKEIVDEIYVFNNEKNNNLVHEIKINNYNAYQFTTDNKLSIPCKEKYGCGSVSLVTEQQIDATFVENSERNKILLILTPHSDNLSKQILNTFEFID